MDGTVSFRSTSMYLGLEDSRATAGKEQWGTRARIAARPTNKREIMPAKRKVTLELIYAKLLSHDRQFQKINKHLVKHDRQFEKIATHLTKHDRHLEKHGRQFEGLIQHMLRMEESLKAEIAEVLDRVRRLEATVEKMTGDLERLQQEYFALTQAVKRIEKTLEGRSIRDEQFNTVLTRLDRIEHHLGLRKS
jgi:chromosome segregation ATPase